MVLTRKNNSKENLRFLMERNLSKKEFTKTMKSIIAKKNNAEKRKKNNKNATNRKTKEAIKNLKHPTMMSKHGTRYSLNISPNRNLSPKRIPHQDNPILN
jgi:hypothetical protein